MGRRVYQISEKYEKTLWKTVNQKGDKIYANMSGCENEREIWEKKNNDVKMREREREKISVVKTMDANFQTIVPSSDELKKGEILEERERVRAI